MVDTMRLEVLTPEKQALAADVTAVYLQGSLGRLGILPQHTALISKLDFGELEYHGDEGTRRLLCGAGLVEVQNDRVTVLVRSAEGKQDIDVKRAKGARERAKSRRDSKDKDVDIHRAEEALQRANQRLRFLGEL